MPRAPRRRPITWPIATRRFKVHAGDLGRAPRNSDSFTAFWDGLPHLLAADSLRAVVSALQAATAIAKEWLARKAAERPA